MVPRNLAIRLRVSRHDHESRLFCLALVPGLLPEPADSAIWSPRLKTVTFFNGPPSLQKVGTDTQEPSPVLVVPRASAAPSAATAVPLDGVVDVPINGVIMVAGATGGVGKRVVAQLLAAGKTVRAMVRDVEKGKQLLSPLYVAPGGRLELVVADITQRKTLLPEFFNGVRAMVVCTAVKIAPKEGDDASRSKYMQGIKFYDPQVVGDTPESVELVGMKNLLDAAGPSLGYTKGFDILLGDDSGPVKWGALDDVVMGGVSQSEMVSIPGAGEDGKPAMVFRGNVSTDNSGGFASIRCRNFEPPADLGAYQGMELKLKGDGQRYKAILRPESGWDSISYCYSFDTKAGEWQNIRIPFDSFIPVFRAKTLPDAPKLDASTIYSLQLMLSKFEYDGGLNPSFNAGKFELPVERISAYTPPPSAAKIVLVSSAASKTALVSSAGVTRPNRPGIDVNVEPPAVRMNDDLGGILTYKLAGEDALRSSGFPYSVVRPCALTEEPRGATLELDQGDTIKGKVSRNDVAELCCALLSSSAGMNTTFEIKCESVNIFYGSLQRALDHGPLLASRQERVAGQYTGKEKDSLLVTSA
eukprot:gene15251-21333_t